jgi:hypothetical protein
MRREQACRRCYQWLDRIRGKDDPHQVRFNHTFYEVMLKWYDEEPLGRKIPRVVRVEWQDGREQTFRGIFHVGQIPERFWERLPDNCKVTGDLHLPTMEEILEAR